MGFAATPVGASAVSAGLSVGIGSGGLAVVVALVVVLGAFYLTATDRPTVEIRTTLAAVVIPLSLTFASIVLFAAFAAV